MGFGHSRREIVGGQSWKIRNSWRFRPRPHHDLARATISAMTDAAKKLLEAASGLPEDERLELASELIASVDGPPDGDWESAWLAELDRRVEAARDKGEPAPEWSEVRARVLSQLGR